MSTEPEDEDKEKVVVALKEEQEEQEEQESVFSSLVNRVKNLISGKSGSKRSKETEEREAKAIEKDTEEMSVQDVEEFESLGEPSGQVKEVKEEEEEKKEEEEAVEEAVETLEKIESETEPPKMGEFPEFGEYFTEEVDTEKISGAIELSAAVISFNIINQYECLAGDELIEKVPALITTPESEVKEAIDEIITKMKKNLEIRELIFQKIVKIFSETSIAGEFQKIIEEVENPLFLYIAFLELGVRESMIKKTASTLYSNIEDASPVRILPPNELLTDRLGLPSYLPKVVVSDEIRNKKVREIIEEGLSGRKIVVTGEKGVGKTTMLFLVYQEAWEDPSITPVIIDTSDPISFPLDTIGISDILYEDQLLAEDSSGIITTIPVEIDRETVEKLKAREQLKMKRVQSLRKGEREEFIQNLVEVYDVTLDGEAGEILAHRSKGTPKYIELKMEEYSHDKLSEEKAKSFTHRFINYVSGIEPIPEDVEVSMTLTLFILRGLKNFIEPEIEGVWKQVGSIAKRIGETPDLTDLEKLKGMLKLTFESGKLYYVPIPLEGIVLGKIKPILQRIDKDPEWAQKIGLNTRKALAEELKNTVREALEDVEKGAITRLYVPVVQAEINEIMRELEILPEEEKKEEEEKVEVVVEEEEEEEEKEKEEEEEREEGEEVEREKIERIKRIALEELKEELPFSDFPTDGSLMDSIEEIESRLNQLQKLSQYSLVLSRINQNLRGQMRGSQELVNIMEENQLKSCREISNRMFKGWKPEERMSQVSQEESNNSQGE